MIWNIVVIRQRMYSDSLYYASMYVFTCSCHLLKSIRVFTCAAIKSHLFASCSDNALLSSHSSLFAQAIITLRSAVNCGDAGGLWEFNDELVSFSLYTSCEKSFFQQLPLKYVPIHLGLGILTHTCYLNEFVAKNVTLLLWQALHLSDVSYIVHLIVAMAASNKPSFFFLW